MNIEIYRNFLYNNLLQDKSCSDFYDKYNIPVIIESKIYEDFGKKNVKDELELIKKELESSQLNLIISPEDIVNIASLTEHSEETKDELFYDGMDGDEVDEINNTTNKNAIKELTESYLNYKKKDESLMHFLKYNYNPEKKKSYLFYLTLLGKECCCEYFDYYIEEQKTFNYSTINGFIIFNLSIIIDFFGNYNNIKPNIYLLMSNKLFQTNISFTNFGFICSFFQSVLNDNFMNTYDIDSPQLIWDNDILKKIVDILP